jgi:hypothetical protein
MATTTTQSVVLYGASDFTTYSSDSTQKRTLTVLSNFFWSLYCTGIWIATTSNSKELAFTDPGLRVIFDTGTSLNYIPSCKFLYVCLIQKEYSFGNFPYLLCSKWSFICRSIKSYLHWLHYECNFITNDISIYSRVLVWHSSLDLHNRDYINFNWKYLVLVWICGTDN